MILITRISLLGTIFTFVACYYKHDICISWIVTQNTLKCAISRAKFHFFGKGTPQTPPQWGRGTPLAISRPPLATPAPFQKSWIRQ